MWQWSSAGETWQVDPRGVDDHVFGPNAGCWEVCDRIECLDVSSVVCDRHWQTHPGADPHTVAPSRRLVPSLYDIKRCVDKFQHASFLITKDAGGDSCLQAKGVPPKGHGERAASCDTF